jgi:ADP-heptose:LPS heptosyltransferase
MNILLIRLKSIGDVIFTLPAVNVVRDNYPTAKITFLTSLENASLLAGFREVNEVIPLDRAAFRSGNPLKVVPQFWGLLRRLRAGKFDLVVDLQGYGETAWLTRLTGAAQRWGSVYGQGREWAYTLGVTRDNPLHHVERGLAILRAGGLPVANLRNTFNLPPAAQTATADFLRKHQLAPTRPLLFLQPFTSTPGKNWPLENYLALARHWHAQGWQIIFGGGPGDQARLAQIQGEAFVISAGVPLLVTGGLMQAATLVIGGDTGALHLAVALGRRVIMIMDSIAPGRAFPFQHPDWTVTPKPGGNVPSIPVAEVVAASEQALKL